MQYLMPQQKRKILDFEDHMEDLRKLFYEKISKGETAGGFDRNEELT